MNHEDAKLLLKEAGVGYPHSEDAGCEECKLDFYKLIELVEVATLKKRLLIDALCGRGFRSIGEAVHYTRVGLAEFCGNQWNEEWCWRRDRLDGLDATLLLQIYENDKK